MGKCPYPEYNGTEYKIVLPKTDNSRNVISNEAINGIIQRVNDRFYGSSNVNVEGCYFSDKSKRFECEGSVRVETTRIYDPENKKHRPCQVWKDDTATVYALAVETAQQFGQESIMISAKPVDVHFARGYKTKRVSKELMAYPEGSP